MVRRHTAQGLAVFVIIFVVASLNFFSFHEVGIEHGFVAKGSAHAIAHGFIFRNPFCHNILSAGYGGIGIGHGIGNEAAGSIVDIVVALAHQHFCQRFESLFSCHFGASAAFGFIGQIDIFQGVGIPAIEDACRELFGEFVLRFYAFDDGGFALFKLSVVVELCIHPLHGELIQSAGCFFAIAANEWYAIIVAEQIHRSLHLMKGDIEFLRNELGYFVCHSLMDIGGVNDWIS